MQTHDQMLILKLTSISNSPISSTHYDKLSEDQLEELEKFQNIIAKFGNRWGITSSSHLRDVYAHSGKAGVYASWLQKGAHGNPPQ